VQLLLQVVLSYPASKIAGFYRFFMFDHSYFSTLKQFGNIIISSKRWGKIKLIFYEKDNLKIDTVKLSLKGHYIR